MPPDDSNGNYSLPAGTIVTTGDTILPSQHNPWANDSASALSARFSKDGRAPATGNWNMNGFRITGLAAPVAGGDAVNKTYGDSTYTTPAALALKLDILQPSVDVASATTTDIGAVSSQNVRVTGTTTITSFGTVAAGTFRRVRFSGALTLTHNSTSLILPGAENIITVAGDVSEFISEGSGNWRCVDYQRSALVPNSFIYGSGSITTTTLAPSATITGIRSTSKQVVCSVTGIQSTAAANSIIVQIGTGGSLATSGYSGAGSRTAASAAATVTQTNGLVIYTNAAAEIVRGILTANLLDESSNQWVLTFVGAEASSALTFSSSSVVSLAGTIDRIAFVANSGNLVAGGKINMRQFS